MDQPNLALGIQFHFWKFYICDVKRMILLDRLGARHGCQQVFYVQESQYATINELSKKC